MNITNKLANLLPRKAYNMYIDVAHCNLRCPMCPRGGINNLQNPDRGLMEFGLFKEIVDKFVKERVWIDGISMGNWGEPLLNPDLPKMIKYAKSHSSAMKPRTSVSINTTLNNSPNPLEFLKSGVNSIKITISGMSQDVYSKNHKGGNIETVLKNIIELVEIRKREKLDKVKLRMVYHNYIYNTDDAVLAEEFCNKHGLRFTPHHPSIISVGDASCFASDQERLGKFYRNFIDLDNEIPLMKTMSYDRIKNCPLKKDRVTINFDGQLYKCCEVFESKHFMGSIFDFDIKEIPNIDSDICKKCADTPCTWHN